MASLNKINAFTTDLGAGYHVLGTNQLAVALTNSAPVATNTVIANITEISYTNCSSRNVTTTSWTNSTGTTAKLVLADLVLTASGTVGPFQYVVLYNTQSTTKTGALIGWYDYGSAVTLANTETFTIDWDQANGALTIA